MSSFFCCLCFTTCIIESMPLCQCFCHWLDRLFNRRYLFFTVIPHFAYIGIMSYWLDLFCVWHSCLFLSLATLIFNYIVCMMLEILFVTNYDGLVYIWTSHSLPGGSLLVTVVIQSSVLLILDPRRFCSWTFCWGGSIIITLYADLKLHQAIKLLFLELGLVAGWIYWLKFPGLI